MSSASSRQRIRNKKDLHKDRLRVNRNKNKSKKPLSDEEWLALGVPQWLIDKVNNI